MCLGPPSHKEDSLSVVTLRFRLYLALFFHICFKDLNLSDPPPTQITGCGAKSREKCNSVDDLKHKHEFYSHKMCASGNEDNIVTKLITEGVYAYLEATKIA